MVAKNEEEEEKGKKIRRSKQANFCFVFLSMSNQIYCLVGVNNNNNDDDDKRQQREEEELGKDGMLLKKILYRAIRNWNAKRKTLQNLYF